MGRHNLVAEGNFRLKIEKKKIMIRKQNGNNINWSNMFYQLLQPFQGLDP